MFDKEEYENTHKYYIPNWVLSVCELHPSERTTKDVDNLVHLMEPLEGYRKFSEKEQRLVKQIYYKYMKVFVNITSNILLFLKTIPTHILD